LRRGLSRVALSRMKRQGWVSHPHSHARPVTSARPLLDFQRFVRISHSGRRMIAAK
jgi:hypothetical protein